MKPWRRRKSTRKQRKAKKKPKRVYNPIFGDFEKVKYKEKQKLLDRIINWLREEG
jgi:hypothetical protein